MDARMTPESTRRDRVPAFPITLADGRDWGFALPSNRLRPEALSALDELGRPIEIIRVVTEFGYPLEIRRLIDDLRSACESGEGQGQYEALIRLAIVLLRRAHDVELADAASLLEVEADALPDFVDAVLSVVTGDRLETPGSPRKETSGGQASPAR